MGSRLPQLRAHIVMAIGLTSEDFQSETMISRITGLDAEIGA